LPPTPSGDTCVYIYFDKAANGRTLNPGEYIGDDEFLEYGLTLSATGGFGELPRLFDTTNPGTREYGDPDLGAPNERCPGGGPGKGEGGEPDGAGPNCSPQGNALIIQEPNDRLDIPDDNVNGGEIAFWFEPKADYVYSIGILDVDDPVKITVYYMDEYGKLLTKIIDVEILGDNSYQVVSIETANVKEIVVQMRRSSAITYLHFCPGKEDIPTVAPPTGPRPTKAFPTYIAPPYPQPTKGGSCSLVTVGFDTAANGEPIVRGQYVQNEWADYGMVLSSKYGYGELPRIFDSANPGTVEAGDPDLGSPNTKCPGGGPGIGIGGEPGAPGKNCDPLYNVLIVQEKNSRMDVPDDNASGGIIIFDFTKSGGTYVKEIQILDIDYAGAHIMIGWYVTENYLKRSTIDVEELGDNSLQTIPIEQDNVAWVKVKLLESGAVPSITFCRI